jgi:ribosomal protein S18 acetylase RimI-like enzyme
MRSDLPLLNMFLLSTAQVFDQTFDSLTMLLTQATICDVAVDPDYTGRGIGRKVVQTLVRNMKLRGPTGFAAFPPPKARRFFFMMGFR